MPKKQNSTALKIFLILMIIFFALPLIVLFLYASSGAWSFPNIVPETFSIRALQYIVRQYSEIILSLITSCIYSLLTVAVTFVLCVIPASLLARENFPSKVFLEALLLSPALLPVMTFSLGVHALFIILGLTDNIFGIVLSLSIFSYPYMLRALTAGYQSYSEDYAACSRNLGSCYWNTLLRVDIPMLLPSIAAGGTVVFLMAFSEYFLVFLIGGGAVRSFTGYLFPFLRSSDKAISSVLTLVFLLVPIILFILLDTVTKRIYRRRGING
jgi:putative spermidine/putrescine transport system permease protein